MRGERIGNTRSGPSSNPERLVGCEAWITARHETNSSIQDVINRDSKGTRIDGHLSLLFHHFQKSKTTRVTQSEHQTKGSVHPYT